MGKKERFLFDNFSMPSVSRHTAKNFLLKQIFWAKFLVVVNGKEQEFVGSELITAQKKVGEQKKYKNSRK